VCNNRNSKIRGNQLIRAFAGARVNPRRSCVYQIPVGIERPEQLCPVASNARLDPPERTFVDEKRSLHRAIMPPKTHGPPCRVIRTASIGETERHFPVILLEPIEQLEFLRRIARHFRGRIACRIRSRLSDWLGRFKGRITRRIMHRFVGWVSFGGRDWIVERLRRTFRRRAVANRPALCPQIRGSCSRPRRFCSPRPSRPPSHRRWPSERRPLALARRPAS
jgi:hypothetical protein